MDGDEALPRATVQKAIKDILAEKNLDFQVTKETIDMLSQACTEFIRMLSAESNTICEKDKKKTIAPEHIIQAMKDLEWEQHVPVLEQALAVEKEESKRLADKLKKSQKQPTMTEEEAAAKQELLFAQSRARQAGGG